MSTYTVTWTISIDADNTFDAAVEALNIQHDQDSIAVVFEVVDSMGNKEIIDLHPSSEYLIYY